MSIQALFICGSLNQTQIMHQISNHLSDWDCRFTPFYVDGWLESFGSNQLLNHTILGGNHRRSSVKYLIDHNLPIDEKGKTGNYDIVITGTDLVIQENIRGQRLVLVQEGMTEPEDWIYQLVRSYNLPRYFANTAATGLSDAYDAFCVASRGYRDLFLRKGVKPDKMVITGIPNFDNAQAYLQNDFPYQGYVLAATSSLRETFKFDDRFGFLRQVKTIANGREVFFKLHPNENHPRAIAEIRLLFPDAPIFIDGNLHHMIANCSVLIAQRTSAVYTALALEKEIHCEFELSQLKQLQPIQNGGTSAQKIAGVCRQLSSIPVDDLRSPAGKIKTGNFSL